MPAQPAPQQKNDIDTRRARLRVRWEPPPQPPLWQRLLWVAALVAIVLFSGLFVFPHDGARGAAGSECAARAPANCAMAGA